MASDAGKVSFWWRHHAGFEIKHNGGSVKYDREYPKFDLEADASGFCIIYHVTLQTEKVSFLKD